MAAHWTKPVVRQPYGCYTIRSKRKAIYVRSRERMLDLNKKKAAERNPHILDQLETQIAATDRQIDRLVYDLYALTPDEIAVVEGGVM